MFHQKTIQERRRRRQIRNIEFIPNPPAPNPNINNTCEFINGFSFPWTFLFTNKPIFFYIYYIYTWNLYYNSHIYIYIYLYYYIYFFI